MLPLARTGLTAPAVAGRGLSEGLGRTSRRSVGQPDSTAMPRGRHNKEWRQLEVCAAPRASGDEVRKCGSVLKAMAGVALERREHLLDATDAWGNHEARGNGDDPCHERKLFPVANDRHGCGKPERQLYAQAEPVSHVCDSIHVRDRGPGAAQEHRVCGLTCSRQQRYKAVVTTW